MNTTSTDTATAAPAPGEGRPSACDNFYRYVNWQWLQEHTIPDSESWWGVFNILGDETDRRLRDICEESQGKSDVSNGSATQLVRDFYSSAMNLDARNRQSLKPLNRLLSQIQEIEGVEDLAAVVATLHLVDIYPFFSIWVDEDFKGPGRNILYVGQSGLGMLNRDYYLDDDKREVREQYLRHITRTFELYGTGKTEAEQAAASVMRLETALAKASLPQETVRQVAKNYHRFTPVRLKRQVPGFAWDTYFERLGIPDIRSLVIGQPTFIGLVAEQIGKTGLADLKHYLTFTLLRSCADTVGEDFRAEHFSFYGQTLHGLKELKPLWKDVIGRMQSSTLTNALGPLYAERYFSGEDRAKVIEIVARVRESFAERVHRLDWMTDRTKGLTLEKLANITFQMGYPDSWIDISTLELGESYATNVLCVAGFEKRRKLAQLNRPYDRSEWQMPPTIVDAISDGRRKMTFPMAILQPPFFDSSTDDAYNYGGIGYVIGHELTHFFDDQGSAFDAEGRLRAWWTREDAAAFRKRSKRFVSYYKRYSADGVPVNARLTLGENISDIGGVAIAFDALQRHLELTGRPVDPAGLTPEQRFFVAVGKVWAAKVRHEFAVQLSIIDPHSPFEVRVNATLSATPPFYVAFGVEEGDGMYTPPKERPALW